MTRSNIQPVDSATIICAFVEHNYHNAFQFPGTAPSIHTTLVLLRLFPNPTHQEPTLNALALQTTPLTLSRDPPLLLTSNAALSRCGTIVIFERRA
jgi:hypothetical protein